MEFDALSHKIIGAAIEVHKELGSGLLESTYEGCLAWELQLAGIKHFRQLEMPVLYKGFKIDCGYRIDLLVEDSLILELKSVENLAPIHEAQLLTYMRLANIRTGLLMNFNSLKLKDGIKRFVL